MTEIIGAPDIYVDRGSTLNVTCAVAAGSKEPEFIMWSRRQKASLLTVMLVGTVATVEPFFLKVDK